LQKQVAVSRKAESDYRTAGILYLVSSIVIILAISLSEALYPNYSVHTNTISDLAATTARTTFIIEPAGFVWGLCWLFGSYFLLRNTGKRGLFILYLLPAIGVLLAISSPENVNVAIHSVGAVLAFIPGAITAIYSYRLIQSELKYFSLVLGFVSLFGVILEFGAYYSYIVQQVLGPGGTERIIVYPLLIWLIGFGAYLTAKDTEKKL
jgi:hypothetical membrane protein